jgi:hypothetical protein
MNNYESHLDADTQEVDQLIEWLSSLGVPSTQNRFNDYRKEFKSVAKLASEKSFTVESSEIDAYPYRRSYWAICELLQWGEIFRELKGLPLEPGLIDLIRRSANGGAYSYSEPSHSLKERDFTFELFLNVLLIRAGALMEFPDTSDKPDLLGSIASTIFIAECKRPKGIHNVKIVMKDALTQLRSRLAVHSAQYCFPAICLDHVLNPTGRIFGGESQLNAHHDMKMQLANSGLVSEVLVAMNAAPKEVIGTLLTYSMPALASEAKSIGLIMNSYFVPREYFEPSHPANKVLDIISGALCGSSSRSTGEA